MKQISAAVLLSLMAACSTQQVYQGAQSMERSRCAREPANTYRECLERQETSYREYTQQRAEAERPQP